MTSSWARSSHAPARMPTALPSRRRARSRCPPRESGTRRRRLRRRRARVRGAQARARPRAQALERPRAHHVGHDGPRREPALGVRAQQAPRVARRAPPRARAGSRAVASSAELMPNTRAALGVGLPTTFDNPTANELNVARALCAPSATAPRTPASRGERPRCRRREVPARAAMDRTRAHPRGPVPTRDALSPRVLCPLPRDYGGHGLSHTPSSPFRGVFVDGEGILPRVCEYLRGFRRDAAQRGRASRVRLRSRWRRSTARCATRARARIVVWS